MLRLASPSWKAARYFWPAVSSAAPSLDLNGSEWALGAYQRSEAEGDSPLKRHTKRTSAPTAARMSCKCLSTLAPAKRKSQ